MPSTTSLSVHTPYYSTKLSTPASHQFSSGSSVASSLSFKTAQSLSQSLSNRTPIPSFSLNIPVENNTSHSTNIEINEDIDVITDLIQVPLLSQLTEKTSSSHSFTSSFSAINPPVLPTNAVPVHISTITLPDVDTSR